jgi:serine protease
MLLHTTRVGALALATSLLALADAAPLAAENNPLRPRSAPAAAEARVIVQYRADASFLQPAAPQHANVMGPRLGLALQDGRPLGARGQVLQGSGLDGEALAQRLAAQPDVEWAVVDRRRQVLATPNDPLYAAGQTTRTPVAGQWVLRSPTSAEPAAIDAAGAWTLSTGLASVVVAVLDTGVRRDHPDLAGALLAGYDFVSDTTMANDGDGRDADPSDPGDWVSSSDAASGVLAGCSTSASSWHGTQVAGLIAARTDNGIGIASVARQVQVLPVRVLGKCGGYDSDIIAGMRWAAGLSVSGVPSNPTPARVLNLSLGGSGSCSRAYQAAVDEVLAAGASIVVAAGNDGAAVATPANCSGVIAVAGLRHSGTKVGYSSLGSAVAIAAPAGNCVNETGTCVYPLVSTSDSGSTVPAGAIYTDGSNPTLGTSFAAPLVAGTVALMQSAVSGLSPATLRSLLQASARSFPSSGAASGVAACRSNSNAAQTSECYCTTSTCGAGMLDAGAAVAAALGSTASTPVAAPVAAISGSSSALREGDTALLDGSGSTAGSGRSLVRYAWQLDSGSAQLALMGDTDGSSVTVQALATGSAVLRLTVTDSAGQSASSTLAITITSGAPQARFAYSPTSPTSSDTVVLDGSGSQVASGRSVVAWRWALQAGADIASFKTDTDGAAATLGFRGAGPVTVALTITDSAGLSHTQTQSFTVAAATAGTTVGDSASTTAASTSSTGGGAVSIGWLLALVAAVGVLAYSRLSRRHRRQPPRSSRPRRRRPGQPGPRPGA